MRIKKKELRKRLPQLPINYPAPEVDPFNFQRERERVENLCKKLAHNETAVREAVMNKLPEFIGGLPSELSDDELALLFSKLCLGIYFYYWHSDKPLVQHASAQKIANLIHCSVTDERKVLFLKALFGTLVREWGKIDQWRMDKYLSLVRKLLHETLTEIVREDQLAAAQSGKPQEVETFEPLNFCQKAICNLQQDVICGESVGMSLHLCDIFFAEVMKVSPSPPLMLYLCKSVPLFALARGDFMEKHVQDFFVEPLCAGVWDESPDYKPLLPLVVKELKRVGLAKSTARTARELAIVLQEMLALHVDQLIRPESYRRVTALDRKRRASMNLQVHDDSNQRSVVLHEAALKKARMVKRKKRPRARPAGNNDEADDDA